MAKNSTLSRPSLTDVAVSLQNINFSYGQDSILEQVTLDIGHGECVALIGPNGGGKTTLLRIMLGFLKPTEGTVSIYGQMPAAIPEVFGYVPQFSSIRSDFPATVLEVVMMGGAAPTVAGGNWRLDRSAKEKAMSYLDALNLSGVAKKQIQDLSGGQRQRALIARALMSKSEDKDTPFLLLMDEPTASIDPQGKFCFFDFLQTLRKNTTILIVSHDLMLVSPFFTNVAFVNHTVTKLPGGQLTMAKLTELFGSHMPECPYSDQSLQRVLPVVHD